MLLDSVHIQRCYQKEKLNIIENRQQHTTQLVKLVAMNTEYTNSRTAPSLQVSFSLDKKCRCAR